MTARSIVAIVGFTEHKKLLNYDDPRVEIWGLNNLYQWMQRADRWFELHRKWQGQHPYAAGNPDHVQRLAGMAIGTGDGQEHPVPIYMWEPDPDIPNAVRYPLDRVLKAFPRQYFNNSISWMLALAILEGFEEIQLYGVDMAQDGIYNGEYQQQRPSVEYFLGIAEGRGIRVWMPPTCDLLRCAARYGLDDISAFQHKMVDRHRQLAQQEAEAVAQYEQAKVRMHQVRGAKADTEYYLRNWVAPEAELPVPELPGTPILPFPVELAREPAQDGGQPVNRLAEVMTDGDG